jgi:hypothetical protein
MTLVAAFAPAIGWALPHWAKIGGFTLGSIMIVWPFLSWSAQMSIVRVGRVIAHNRPARIETQAKRIERQKKDFPGFEVPRMELKSIPRILEAGKLLELAGPWLVIVPHKLVSTDAETCGYISDVLAVLRSEIERKQQSNDESTIPASPATVDDLKRLFVLLKGNGIYVYANTHLKRLPERWEIPYQPDPYEAELQLVIAFWPAGQADAGRVDVQVDNGQPHWVRSGLGS